MNDERLQELEQRYTRLTEDDDLAVANDVLCEALGGHIWRMDDNHVCCCLRCGNEAQR